MLISGRALGSKKPLFADWSLPLPPDLSGDDGVTLRDVVGRIVREEVAAFQKRQSDRKLLHVLTARDVAAGAAKGKIQAGGSDVPLQKVDPDEAVATALQAFEDGIFLIVIDDEDQRSLDKQVYLKPDSRVTFIRLTLLAGG